MRFPLLKATKKEHLRYDVESETEGQGTHMVDLLEKFCSCMDHQANVPNRKPFCKHAINAKLAFADEILDQIRSSQKQHKQ